MRTAAENQYGILKLLIDRGADMNAQAKDGSTAMMNAAWYGRLKVIELLVNSGADVNARDAKGGTAAFYASGNGHQNIVELLEKHMTR
ncbi:MAG: ankyrin repeat domain-containing protein [Candidatus Methylomirabilis sp.]|nr:ankyrin repeat domain-containing protein [Candidatus Methylomirabilis sp.]